MIPKIIHYCWFGGKALPDEAVRCVESWRKFCPDYEIREWNEKNFDISASRYASEAYEAKKWAFVADYVRIFALWSLGGVYMDTDVEVVRPLDDFLGDRAFIGFEEGRYLATCVMGAERDSQWAKMILDDYARRHFKTGDGYDMTTNVVAITRLTDERYGFRKDDALQELGDVTIYPTDRFSPIDHAGRMHRTDDTHAIHWFAQSWVPWHRRMLHKLKVLAYKILPGR